MNGLLKPAGIALAIALCHGTAQAQVQAPKIVANQDVKSRVQPGYEPIALPLFGLNVLPMVTAETHVTDNYQAVSVGKKSDIYFNLRPEVNFRSNWNRHSFGGNIYLNESKHALRPTEDAFTYGAALQGVYDFSRDTQFHADLSFTHDVESRSNLGSYQGTVKPVRHNEYVVSAGVAHSVSDLTLNADVRLDILKYTDGQLPGGIVVSQYFRNDKALSLIGGATYDLGNGIGLTLNGQYDKVVYDFRPGQPGFIPGLNLDRSSHGFSLLGGVNLELSRLIFGTLQVGYLKRSYADPQFRGFNGLSFKANVLWNVTPLTSLGLRAGRTVQDNGSLIVAGNTRTDTAFTVNHELYRYVLLSGEIDYAHYRPNGPGFQTNELGGMIGVRYLVDRHLTLNGELRHSGRTTTLAGFGYQQNSAFIGAKFVY
ncbi:MAG: outer membrane beta-barrel protein [Novosphingobium sp.]